MMVLAIRVLLMLLSAGTGNAFVDTIYSASSAFAWPFSMFLAPVTHGQWNIDVASLAGIMTYGILLTVLLQAARLLKTDEHN